MINKNKIKGFIIYDKKDDLVNQLKVSVLYLISALPIVIYALFDPIENIIIYIIVIFVLSYLLYLSAATITFANACIVFADNKIQVMKAVMIQEIDNDDIKYITLDLRSFLYPHFRVQINLDNMSIFSIQIHKRYLLNFKKQLEEMQIKVKYESIKL